jgi:4-amino-4-deoxy-L-arabinose transferase-like glycosyltransferase
MRRNLRAMRVIRVIRIAVAWLLSLGTIVLMGISATLMQPAFRYDAERYFAFGMLFFALGVLALGVALLLWRSVGAGGLHLHGRIATPRTTWRTPLRTLARWLKRRPVAPTEIITPIRTHWFLLGMMPVVWVVQINLLNLQDEYLSPFWQDVGATHPYIQALLLFLGWSIMLWALAGGGRILQARWWDVSVWRLRGHHVALLLIVLLGFVLRVWNLETWSSRFLDEMHYMYAVARIWANDGVQILMPFSDVTAFSWLYPLAQSITAGFVGANFTGVRLMSAFMGTAQIIALYVLARSVVPRRTALLAALILATFPPHLQFSKIGINNIADPLFGMMALAFLVRGLRSRRVLFFVLAGACLGWTHYFYEGGRLFFSAFAVLWLGWLYLFGRRDSALRFPPLALLVRMALAFAVVVVPMYYVWVIQDVPLASRFERMSDGAQQASLANGTLAIPERVQPFIDKLPLPPRGLVQMPDTSWFYSGETGLVLWFLAPLLLLGIAHVLWRWRTVGGSLLLWWLLAVLVANALIVDSIASPRYIVVMGVLALLMAIGATHTFTLLLASLKRAGLRRFLLRLGVAGFSITIISAQLLYYYGVHVPDYYENTFYDFFDHKTGRRFVDTNDAILRAMTLPSNTDAHIVSANLVWGFDMTAATMYFQRNDMTIRHVFPDELDEQYLYGLSPFRNQAFFLQPFDGENFTQISTIFPVDMRQSGFNSRYNIPQDSQLWLYFAPATYQLHDGILRD